MKPRAFRETKDRGHGEPLAIDPKALELFFEPPTEYRGRVVDGVAILTIEGPLEHRAGYWFDSYESILCRFAAAIRDPDVASIVLDIDSPGGNASGMYETVRLMRKMKARAGKPVFTWSNERAFSAAYGLATVGDQIFLPRSAGVGSIGVITELCDQTKLNERIGLRFEVITSGARKADGHPDLPISEQAKKRTQARVDDLASQFFELVAEARPLSVGKIQSYQAMTYYGDEAVKRGLADAVTTFRGVMKIARLAPPPAKAVGSTSAGKEKPMKVKALLKLIETSRVRLAKTKDEDEKKSLRAFIAEQERKVAAKMASDEKKKEEEEEEEEASEAEESEAESESEEEEEESESESESEAGSSYSKSSKSSTSSTGSSMSTGAEEEEEGASAKTGLHTKDRLLRMCRQITGKRSLAEVMGTLDAWARGAKKHEALARKVEKMSREGREEKVEAMIKTARAEGRIARGQKAELRLMGMQSPKRLKAFLEGSPPIYGREHDEKNAQPGARSGASGQLAEVASKMGIDVSAVEAMQKDAAAGKVTHASGQSMPIDIPGAKMNGARKDA